MGEHNPNSDGCTRILLGAALTSRLQAFETEMLAKEENFAGLTRLNQALIGRTDSIDSLYRAVFLRPVEPLRAFQKAPLFLRICTPNNGGCLKTIVFFSFCSGQIGRLLSRAAAIRLDGRCKS